jgi:DNA-binding NarL/FixJ family response regulator
MAALPNVELGMAAEEVLMAKDSRIAGLDDAPVVAVLSRDADLRSRAAAILASDGQRVVQSTGSDVEVLVLCLGATDAVPLHEIRALREVIDDRPIVVVAGTSRGRRVVRSALRARVEGLVYGDQMEVALASAVRAVLAEQVVVPRESRRLLAPALSQRERQVLALVVLGYGNSFIADRLFLSESTVKSHLTSVFAKLGVSSRGEATSLILDPGEPVGRAVLAAIQPDLDVFGEGASWS